MLAQKMAQFCSENDAEQHGVKDAPGEKDVESNTVSPADTEGATSNSEAASGRSLTKQWSTSSKSSRSSKRGGKMLLMTCSCELPGPSEVFPFWISAFLLCHRANRAVGHC